MSPESLPVSLPETAVDHPSVWVGDQMRDSSRWIYQLDAGELDELRAAIDPVETDPVDFLSLGESDFPLPRLGPRLKELRQEILHGRGFVQMRGVPVADQTVRESALMFWGIGRHLGDQVVSQNKHGHVLGHVRNLGQSVNNASERGPYSADRIPWHVDSCDIVGLMCRTPAVRGGESSIASSSAIFNRLLEQRPDLVQALARDVYRDRRDEIPAGKEAWYVLPVFNYYEGFLSTSIEPTYIGSAGRHFDSEPNDDLVREGVAAVQAIADEIRLDIPFEPGDMQFLNNYTIMHTRQAFEDAVDPNARRHLLRMWLINHDGRPLSDAYYERHGDRATVRRPGGIVGQDTVLCSPL